MLRVLLTGRITIADGTRTIDETSIPGTLGRVALAILVLERQRVAHDVPLSYTHLLAHEYSLDLVCRRLL